MLDSLPSRNWGEVTQPQFLVVSDVGTDPSMQGCSEVRYKVNEDFRIVPSTLGLRRHFCYYFRGVFF